MSAHAGSGRNCSLKIYATVCAEIPKICAAQGFGGDAHFEGKFIQLGDGETCPFSIGHLNARNEGIA